VRRFAIDTVVICRRSLKTLVRTPLIVVFASIQPVMFVLLFRYVFGGSIVVPGYRGYVDYLIPGIIAQTTLFGGSSLAIVIANDMTAGITDRFRSLPMSRAAILAGATIAAIARNLFTITLITLVGMLVGFRFHTGPLQVLLALAIALLFGHAFAWLFALIGILVRNPEGAQLASFLPIFPLVFAASTFTSPRTMPSALRWFAEHQPITQIVDAIRALTQGVQPATDPTLKAIAWSLAILVVSAVLATRRLRSL
jgi:ABC transporter DrrB family efflux protein